jgi:hypothetical protein
MFKIVHNSKYQHLISNIINHSKKRGNFIFSINKNIGAIKSLSLQSINVPNTPGLYFLFCETENINDPHVFEIYNKKHSLLYFGKAGQKKDGAIVKQGLKGRLNNVITDSKRKLKDVPRAKYWEVILNELSKTSLMILWVETSDNCVELEETIYEALGSDNITYPFLNKKRGKSKKI